MTLVVTGGKPLFSVRPCPICGHCGRGEERRERRKEVLSEEVELNSAGIAQDIYRHFIA